MRKIIKEAFLKHDLYQLKLPENTLYTLDNIPKLESVKVASEGIRFVYFIIDDYDPCVIKMDELYISGWYSEELCKNKVFSIFDDYWAAEHLSTPQNIII
jgi:hypothetical protein